MEAWAHWLWKGREGLPAARAALEAPDNDPKVGDAEGALESYERLIAFTGAYSVPFLELDVVMDPVRGHPRYETLVGSK